MKIKICFAILLAVGFASLSYGESETLLSEYDDKINGRFDVGGGGTYKSFDGTEVGYWSLPGVGRPIVFITGLGETFLHYRETTWDLRTLDRPIYIVELRSQGHGERLSSASPQIYYLESFEDYKKDFDTFMRQIVEEEEPTDIVAHSTGAYPAVEYAVENSDRVRQLILVAPLVKPNLGSVPDWAAKLMAHSLCFVGMCDHYVPSRKDYVLGTAKFEGTMLTNSEIRFERIFEVGHENPQLLSGGPSNRWLIEAMKLPERMFELAPELNTPIIHVSASDDAYSTNPEQKKFCALAPDCNRVVIEDSKHVLFHETDRVRNELMEYLSTALTTGTNHLNK